MSKLVTVPTFEFRQGDPFDHEQDCERPIYVEYYNGDTICLRQEGNFDVDEEIIISKKHLKALFKAINKHLPEAEDKLKKL